MLIRNVQNVLLAVVLLSAVLATPALGQEATDEQSEELQDVLANNDVKIAALA